MVMFSTTRHSLPVTPAYLTEGYLTSIIGGAWLSIFPRAAPAFILHESTCKSSHPITMSSAGKLMSPMAKDKVLWDYLTTH